MIRLLVKPDLSKHERIRQTLTEAIANVDYKPGQRPPSESELLSYIDIYSVAIRHRRKASASCPWAKCCGIAFRVSHVSAARR